MPCPMDPMPTMPTFLISFLAAAELAKVRAERAARDAAARVAEEAAVNIGPVCVPVCGMGGSRTISRRKRIKNKEDLYTGETTERERGVCIVCKKSDVRFGSGDRRELALSALSAD